MSLILVDSKDHRVLMETIVLGANHNNTLGLIWSLGEAGHNVTLLLYKHGNNYVAKSKYIKKCFFLDAERDDTISCLISVSKALENKPVVFVSSDNDAALLNDHFEELHPYCFFECGKTDGSVNIFRDKDAENGLAQKCGFLLPKNIVLSNKEEIHTIKLSFPIIIKANNSIHGGKTAMLKCDTLHDAEEFVLSLPDSYFPLQVQEFIDKDYEIMILGCSLDGGEKVLCPIANRKIRQYPNPSGLVSYSESIAVRHHKDLEQLSEMIAKYLKEIYYTGLFSAEFLYYKEQYYFLEINLRNDGTSWLSTCSGYNLPDIVCHGLTGKEYLKENFYRKRYYMNIVADFHYVKDGSISLLKWLKLFNKQTCYSHLNFRDIRPFLYYVGSLLKH